MEHEGKIILEKESIKLIDCNSCGIIHQHPQPTEKQLNAYYKKKYFKTKRSKDYFKQQIKQQEYLDFCNSEKETTIRRLLSKKMPHSIIDIGCGSGHFLRLFKKKGWCTAGIEPNKQLYEKALKKSDFNIFSGTFKEFLSTKHDKYAVVNMCAVLEHVRDALGLLKKIERDILLPKGIICIDVPNDFNQLQQIINKSKKDAW